MSVPLGHLDAGVSEKLFEGVDVHFTGAGKITGVGVPEIVESDIESGFFSDPFPTVVKCAIVISPS